MHCEITGDLGEVRRKYSIGETFQSGERICCISEITKMEIKEDTYLGNESQNVLNICSLNNDIYLLVDPSWCKGDIDSCQKPAMWVKL